ncbi:hypothetical protein AG0111_0g2570 [Alternaria gaisen]|uniref:Uncharacterized protein n=1 Tax=Alternaria gaisen TaxID=167740 RepID=A0ACB6FXR1_9PLEO|nr:hypothetical protein AG0111_0g2570 [Alternaria gaisen]
MSQTGGKGPGLFYVRSGISPSAKDVLSEATFMRWYEEHVEEVVAKSGIHSLFRSASLHQFDRQILLMNDVSRYNATSKTSAFNGSKPFLTFPVLDDIGFLLSEEFKSISPTSEILPGTGNVFDLVEFDGNHLALRQNLMIKKGNNEPAKSIVTVEIQPPTGLEADEVSALLGKQVSRLNGGSGYTGSLIFESCFSFASAGARKPEGGKMEMWHEPPSWVAIHTFSGAVGDDMVKLIELDLHEMYGSTGNMRSEVRAWSLQGSFGGKKLFE